MKLWLANLRAHPELGQCRCGRVGFRFKAGDRSSPVCKRCDEIENYSYHLKQLSTKRVNVKWNEPTQRMIDYMDVPKWVIEAAYSNAEMLLMKIESWIDDNGTELVVHGHGEYHLPLNQMGVAA